MGYGAVTREHSGAYSGDDLLQSQLAPEIGIATCRKLAVVCAEAIALMPVAVDATGGDGTSRIRREAVPL
jgi:hypothetical protein